jgi:hypothetical protein
MRTRAALAAIATIGVLASGCASSSDGGSPKKADAQHSASSTSGRSAGKSGMDMADMNSGTGPSAPAKLICGDEIKDAVRRTFAMSTAPTGTPTWSKADQTFSCRWQVPHGTLAMSVQDTADLKAGRAYFDRLRARLAGARRIGGMENFGFPAFSTPSGNVVFLKDGKTLRVDASSLSKSALPSGFSREDTAFSIASAVIACWSE